MPLFALIAAIIVNTNHQMNSAKPAGTAMIKPMPSVKIASKHNASPAIMTVMLKFSASLPWSSTKVEPSRLNSQTSSGPAMMPMPVTKAVNVDKCANNAQVRSSVDGVPDEGNGGGVGGVMASVSLIIFPPRYHLSTIRRYVPAVNRNKSQ